MFLIFYKKTKSVGIIPDRKKLNLNNIPKMTKKTVRECVFFINVFKPNSFLATTTWWKGLLAVLSRKENVNKEEVCVCGLNWPDQYDIVLSVQRAWWNPPQINIQLIVYIQSAPRHTEQLVRWATGAELTIWLIVVQAIFASHWQSGQRRVETLCVCGVIWGLCTRWS